MKLNIARLAKVRFWANCCVLASALSCTAVQEIQADQEFTEWIKQRSGGIQSLSDSQSLAIGVRLAESRAAEFRALLEKDPVRFIQLAMPEADRAELPTILQPYIERHIKGRGSFRVFCAGQPNVAMDSDHAYRNSDYEYEVQIDGITYRGFVFGNWRNQSSVREAWIEGVALGGAIVLGDSPTPDEQIANGEPVTADAPTTTGPNTLLYIIARFSDQSSDPISDATALINMSVVSNFWFNNSSGTVWLRGLVNSTQVMDIVHITLPIAAGYASNYNNNFDLLLSDARNAASAKGFNYANYNLDMVVTTGSGFGYAGRAYIGGQGAHCVAGSTSLRTAGHELGHNLGLWHANYWRSDSTRCFGKDSVPGGYVADTSNSEWIEYGHYFSVMSAQNSGEMNDASKPHYTAAEKVDLGWLSGSEVQYVNTSGSYRLYRHDSPTTAGTPRAIRIETPASDYTGSGRRYWLNYRFAPWSVGADWLRNGLQIDVCQSSYGSDGAIQLDMTPFSNDANSGASYTSDNTDKRDGALIVGRTYSDTAAGIHITPVATGSFGTNEEYIDVVVNLGTFPGNRAPAIAAFTSSTNQATTGQLVNFAVTASDPDGDSLAYAWDFDQLQTWTQSGLNSPNATKNWTGAGQYRVTVTVSDRKGGIASESAIVTVGSPASKRQIWGRVLWGGTPVYNARVWSTAGSTVHQAWTDSDGTYVLTDLAETNTYLLKCQRDGLTFTAQFANPVAVSTGDFFGNDFYANQSLPGGGGADSFALSGQVTYAGDPVSGAEVRTGGKVVTTDASGNYQFTNFPPGSYTVLPRKDSWIFSPASRTVTLSAANSSGNNFSRVAPYSISGRVDGPPTSGSSPAPIVFLSNGQSVQATKQGSGGNRYWGYTLTEVPPGQFSLSSGLSGWLIQPSGFSNPLNVSGSLSSINFNGTSSATAYGAINGRITERGVPLSGASVVARVGGVTVLSTTTDSDGYYRLANLTNGSYSVVPSLSGYTFSPSSTTASSPSSDKNFTATSSSTPPSIGSIVAAPTVVSNVNSTATFTVIATGFAPFSYSWDALTAPAPVAFSANDSPVANTTVVSFQSPGSYTFRARVVDGHGFVTTANVGLTVSAGAGALVVSPYEVQVPAGQSMAFSADAWDQLGNPTSVSPQWSVTGGGTINGSGVFAATTPGGPWQVVATTATLAATGTVWVTETSVSPPVILAQPLNQTVGVGSNVTFTVSASGTSPLYYQWRWHGTNLPGATASSYTRTNVQLFAAGLYSVEITNSVGSVLSSNAALTVIEPPQITTQPISRAIAAGSNVTFTVVASGTPPLAFQWRLNGTNLPAATTNTLQLLSAQPSNAGLYTVLVNNLAGTTTSAAAALTVNSFPALSLIADRTIHAGSALVMTTSVLDPDSPSQALTFGLAPGAPANSTINPTNGIFAWTTTLGDANTTNTVTVTVADDGVPSLSDSQSFAIRVVPPLTIASITVSNTTITICWTAIPGRTYQVQFKDDLDASPWIALQPDVLATNSVIHRTDVISIPRRLYRIALLP